MSSRKITYPQVFVDDLAFLLQDMAKREGQNPSHQHREHFSCPLNWIRLNFVPPSITLLLFIINFL